MRRLSRAIITGSLAFSLVAAAAAGTAFTINSVEGIPITTTDAAVISIEPCDGDYDIDWTVEQGQIVGFEATRTPPSTLSDPGLQYCADMPWALYIAEGDDVVLDGDKVDVDATTWTLQWDTNLVEFTTDVNDGSIDALNEEPIDGSLILEEGTAVLLEIGPSAPTLTGDDD